MSVSYNFCQVTDISQLEGQLENTSGQEKIDVLIKLSYLCYSNSDTTKSEYYLELALNEYKNLEKFGVKSSNNSKTSVFNYLFSVIILVLSLVWILRLYHVVKNSKRKISVLENEITFQKNEIYKIKSQISDSISYARKIQDSILVPEAEIKKYLPEMFIYFEPRDIVSGDFYWFSKVEYKYIIAAIDCTGHGIPGAFLSMIGNTLLNEIVNDKGISKPDDILSLLHIGVLKALKQNREDAHNEDGMDMSLCTIDVRQKRFQFAGAKNHLYVIQGDQLKVLKANYLSIGGKALRPDIETHVKFTFYDFMYDDKTSIYMLSDGYLDQFGGLEDTKFNSQRFKDMLLKNRALPMEEQKQKIKNALEEWKGDKRQVDDILVLGVKLSEKM
jgi:serine phosphatase RsbU (regulator of sigma subunit)